MFAISRRRRSGTVLVVAVLLSLAVGIVARAGFDAPRANQLARLSPSGLITWSGFTPGGWVTVLPVVTSVVASATETLDPATGAYAISTDAGITWSDWLTGHLSISGPGTNLTLAVSDLDLPDSAAANLIRFRIAPIGGTVEDSSPYVIKVDAVPPAAPGDLAATPGGWSKTNSFAVSWTNPESGVGIAGAWYKLDSPPASAADGLYTPASNSISGITMPSDGVHVLYLWLQDSLGRVDHTKRSSVSLYLDRVAPSPPFGLQGTPSQTWTNVNSFAETWTNPSDPSGIAGVYYRLDSPGASPTDGDFVPSSTSLSGIVVPADGKHDLYIWLVDGAGNASHLNRNIDPEVFWFDGTAPTSSASVSGQPSATGWFSSTVSVALSGSDPGTASGLDAVYSELDGAPRSDESPVLVSGDGRHSLLHYARDVAGNQEPAKQVEISIDQTAPTVSLTADREPAATGWYSAPVTVSLSIVDPLSGPDKVFYRIGDDPWQTGPSLVLSDAGVYSIDTYGTDLAGNSASIGTTTIRIDGDPPTAAHLVAGTLGANGWYTSPVTVTLTPQDSVSGVATSHFRIDSGPWQEGTTIELSTDGIHSLSYYSTDAAGNVGDTASLEVKLDATPPTPPTAIRVTPEGWSKDNRFTVEWASPEDVSGLAGVFAQLDVEPTGPGDGVFYAVTDRLEDFKVPQEGVHFLYLWLQDNAGNADARNTALAPVLYYDGSPPDTVTSVEGLVGTDDWYRSPVTVTLTPADTASGVKVLNYRVNDGEWISTTQPSVAVHFDSVGSGIIAYSSEDVAGNVEPVKTRVVQIDMTPPPAPVALTATLSGWQRSNDFGLSWQPIVDDSGIAGAYVKVGSAPTGPADGKLFPGAASTSGITVPGPGQHSVWVWLSDRAGNADHATAVMLDRALWYDGDPPASTTEITGTAGLDGWYRSPVTFKVTATDATSGVAGVRYQIDDGAWTTGASFVVGTDGEHTVRVAAVDRAGNTEEPRVASLRIDTHPPLVQISVPQRQEELAFEISWGAADPSPGSGLTVYDVRWRDGYTAPWQVLQSGTLETTASVEGERGHTYFFRVSIPDQAGNTQVPPVVARVLIEPVLNGDFSTGNFDLWTTSGLLYKAVVPLPGPTGTETPSARLGTDAYGPSLTDPGNVPVGNAMIRQQVRIPDSSQVVNACLSLAYRVFSYDVMYSQRLGAYVDTFEVSLAEASGKETLLMRDGNPTSTYGQLYDSKWRGASFDLRRWSGQTVTLAFASYNRSDNLFNTWSYVDDIRIGECRPSYVPFVFRNGRASASGAGVASGATDTAVDKPGTPSSVEPPGEKR